MHEPWRAWDSEDLKGFVAPIHDEVATVITDAREGALSSFPAPDAKVDDRDPIPFGDPPDRFRRQAIVHRYNPKSERFHDSSDPLDFPWYDDREAVSECWASTYPGHSSRAAPGERAWTYLNRRLSTLKPQDLVFVHRSGGQTGRHPNGRHVPPRSLIGVWAVEALVSWPDEHWQERLTDVYCAPLRLFDYPVELRKVRDRDPAIDAVGKFRGGAAMFDLDGREEALAVARVCSLPASIYDHDDLDQLKRELLKYPTGDLDADWGRLSPGVWQARENTLTEWVGMEHAASKLAANGWAIALVHNRPGLGYDLAARRLYPDGAIEDLRVEVKSTKHPWDHPVTLQPSQRHAGSTDPRWLLATVHDAHGDPDFNWWTWADVDAGRIPTR